jgi:hypothetical protein
MHNVSLGRAQGGIRNMKKELLRQIINQMLQDPDSELCRLCADFFGMTAAEFATAMRPEEMVASDDKTQSPIRLQEQVDVGQGSSRSQVLPLSQIFEVINKRGRHSEPRVLHLREDNLYVPRRSRELGGGWQFVMLRVVEDCLANGLQVPWSFGSQQVVAWQPGSMTNPKTVRWGGRDAYVSTNRSGPNIVDICNSMYGELGLDPDKIRVEITFEDKH